MYGDSYYEDVDPIVLNQIMECMPKKLENVEQKSLKNKLLSSSLRDVNDVLLQKQFYIWGGEE